MFSPVKCSIEHQEDSSFKILRSKYPLFQPVNNFRSNSTDKLDFTNPETKPLLNPHHFFKLKTTDDDGVVYFRYPKAADRRVSKRKVAAIEARRITSEIEMNNAFKRGTTTVFVTNDEYGETTTDLFYGGKDKKENSKRKKNPNRIFSDAGVNKHNRFISQIPPNAYAKSPLVSDKNVGS